MKTRLLALSINSALSLSLAGSLLADGLPRCTGVDPDTAKTGDTINITCENVDKSTVADLYLTDGKADTKIAMMEHNADKIKFTVPKIKPGRYHIAFLTANKASIVEQPVVLNVE